MSPAETSFVQSAPPPADGIFAEFAASRRSRSHIRTLAAIGNRSLRIHFLMVAALFVAWQTLESSAAVLILGGVVFFAGSLVIARNEARASPLLITPLSWLFVWQAFTLGLSPIWIGSRLADSASVSYVGQTVSIDNVAAGFFYYALGGLAMHFALQRTRPKGSIAYTSRHSSSESLGMIVILSSCGIFIALFGSRLAALGTFAAPLQMGSLSAACSLAIAPPRSLPHRSPMYWYAVVAAVAVCTFANALSGLKTMLMLSVLPIVWIFLISRNLRKTLLLLIPALAFAYVYAVEPVVDGLRSINRSADIKDSLIENAEGGNLGQVASLEQDTFLQRLDKIAQREFYGTYVGFLVQDAKAYGFKMGETMDYLVYSFVPRIFWPGKPNVSRGKWLTVYLGAADSEDTATTASALTAQGELYWNFGIPGLIIGMAALGWLIGRFLWQTAGADPRENPVRMLALLITILLVSGEAEAGTMFVTIFVDVIVLRLMLTLMGVEARRRSPVSCGASDVPALRLGSRLPTSPPESHGVE
jgi:hypothetical protein